MSAPVPLIQKIEKQYIRENSLPEFRAGDTVKVWVKIREGQKTRLQAFEGVCIKRSHGSARATFTVRKISYGVGVERIFAVNSPNIDKVEVVSRGKVRQARLYYLRSLRGKAARIKERAYDKSAEKKKRRPRRKKRKAAKEAAKAAAAAEATTGKAAEADKATAAEASE